MPKVEIDYSNTIFYKIFCKDPAIKEIYVGLTTNFVQRRHAHKQSCKNEKAFNHNCKLYSAIRKAGGWDNWQMEIIAFHNCADSYEARKKEHEYFEALGATLNSIDPFPKPKLKDSAPKFVKEKKNLFCKPCNVHFSHWTAQERHNNTNKHHKMVATHIPHKLESNETPFKYICLTCDYKCSKKYNWEKHLNTDKHKNAIQESGNGKQLQSDGHKFACENCNRLYNTNSGLWKHKQQCKSNKETVNKFEDKGSKSYELTELVKCLMKENLEMKTMMMEQSNIMMEVIKNGMINITKLL